MSEEQKINEVSSDTEQVAMPAEGYGYTGNPFEEFEQDLCKRCKTRRIDRSENPQSVLCRECRDELIKLKVPVPVIVCSIITALLVIVCIAKFGIDLMQFKSSDMLLEDYFEETRLEDAEDDIEDESGSDFADSLRDSGSSSEGEQTYTDPNTMLCSVYENRASMGEVVTAMDSMAEVVENDPDNIDMAITLADVAMQYSYPDYAAWVIENYLVGKTVDDADADRINGYIDELNVYYDTYDVMDVIYTEETENMGDTEEDYYAMMQNCHDRIAEYIGNDAYDQALLEYNISFFCMDDEEWITHLENCIAEDDCYYDAHAQLANYYRRNGDLEKAREILRPIYWKNKEDYSLLRAYATLEMAEGRLDVALTYAEKAYELCPDGDYVADTYIVALKANGQDEEALIREWEDSGYIFDDDFYDYQMGDMTLEEYYIGE